MMSSIALPGSIKHVRLLLIILVCILLECEAQTGAISPLYLNAAKLENGPTEALLYELDIETQQTRNVTTSTYDPTTELFYGSVIYYNTGVYYALYGIKTEEGQLQSSNLLAIDTKTGEKLFNDLQLEGLVYGIAINQLNGDIHYINYTANQFTPTGMINSGDWSVYNAESGETTRLKKAIIQNTTFAYATSWAYNSETSSLYNLAGNRDNVQLVEFSESTLTYKVYNIARRMIGNYYSNMAINPKTNQLYVIDFDVRIFSPVTIYVDEVIFENDSSAKLEPQCTLTSEDSISSYAVTPYQTDVDYVSGSVVTNIFVSTSLLKVYNALYVIDLSTCDYIPHITSHVNLIGTPRFFPSSQ